MTRKYRLSRKADIGLAKIWQDIAAHNVQAADGLYFRILRKIGRAAEYPGVGSASPGIGKGVRTLVEGSYNIYYVQNAQGIVITAIVHSKRLPANWL